MRYSNRTVVLVTGYYVIMLNDPMLASDICQVFIKGNSLTDYNRNTDMKILFEIVFVIPYS